MAKIRVHELAKEFGLSSKEMASRIKEMGYPIKNYMSTLEDYEIEDIRKRLREEGSTAGAQQEREKAPESKVVIRKKKPKVKIKKILIKKSGDSKVAVMPDADQRDNTMESAAASEAEESLSARQRAEQQPFDESLSEPAEGMESPEEKVSAPEEAEEQKDAAKRTSRTPKVEVKIIKRPEPEPEPEPETEIEPAAPVPPVSDGQVPGHEQPELDETAGSELAEKEGTLQEESSEETVEEAGVAEEGSSQVAEETAVQVSESEGVEESSAQETAPEEETKPLPVEKQEVREKEKAQPKPKEGKSLVKIVDRKIDLSALKKTTTFKGRSKRPGRPAGAAPKKKAPARDVLPETGAPPMAPAPEGLPSKGKKKGKRVVKAAEFGGGKRRKPVKQKGRKASIHEILREEAGYSRGGRKSAKAKARDQQQKHAGTAPIRAEKRKIVMSETIQVSEFAKRMGVKLSDIIMKLMGLGVMVTANQTIDFDTASLVASEFDYEVEKKSIAEDIVHEIEEAAPTGEGKPRPPVVTVMGHVDHGKTTLLDAIRDADVAAGEAGGITQHIGAYQVELPAGDKVTFIDTPGHEAFTSMRARGAQVTDIIILVVAADDGVMAQTREAIDHAKAAGVPLIVAVNKIDKPGANPDRVKTELSELGLVPEDWGGDTIFVNISAKKKIGIDELLELMTLQAEVLELKADPDRPAMGHVIESKLDKGRGPVATVIIQQGTLKVGDAVVCGLHYGRIRAMVNDKGENVQEAGPATPVEIQGLSGVPEAGNELLVLPSEKKAREVAEYRQRKAREAELARTTRASLDNLFEKIQQEKLKRLHLILKADVQGSLEALGDSLKKLSTDKVQIDIVRGGIGAITESDVLLASASDAIIIGFNVKPTPKAKQLAEQENIEIRFYDVIYHAIEEIKGAMVGMLEPVYKEVFLGRAEVRETFRVSKVGTIAGCYVQEGTIRRNANCRLLRDNVVVYTGKIGSLRRFKDDVKAVQSGYECGIGLENFNDIKVGDVIEAYEMEEVAPDLGLTAEESKAKEDGEKGQE